MSKTTKSLTLQEIYDIDTRNNDEHIKLLYRRISSLNREISNIFKELNSSMRKTDDNQLIIMKKIYDRIEDKYTWDLLVLDEGKWQKPK